MKNKIIISIVILWSIIEILGCGKVTEDCEMDPPRRLDNIPVNTVWGGCYDGGFWFEAVEFKKIGRYRIRIYDEQDGKLVLDADFKFSNSNSNSINKKRFYKSKIGFFYQYLMVDQYRLEPIYPAYGGTYWDTIKDK